MLLSRQLCSLVSKSKSLLVGWFVILFLRVNYIVTVSVNHVRRKAMQITVLSVLQSATIKITT
jgi:hypothetical protein